MFSFPTIICTFSVCHLSTQKRKQSAMNRKLGIATTQCHSNSMAGTQVSPTLSTQELQSIASGTCKFLEKVMQKYASKTVPLNDVDVKQFPKFLSVCTFVLGLAPRLVEADDVLMFSHPLNVGFNLSKETVNMELILYSQLPHHILVHCI